MTIEIEAPLKTLEDELPRYKETNPRNYDTLTLARKRTELKAMVAHYKDMSPAWLEMCWDFVENTSKERIAEIIQTKEFEKPCTSTRDMKGGIVKNAITITTRTPEEIAMREHMLNDYEIEANKSRVPPLQDGSGGV